MSQTGPAPGEVRVLLSLRNESTRALVKALLEGNYPTQLKISSIDVLQDAIELLEKESQPFHLIFFEHNSSSLTFVKALLDLGKDTSFVMISNEASTFEGLKSHPKAPEFILTNEAEDGLYKVLKKLSLLGKVPPLAAPSETEYVPLAGDAIVAMNPLRYDVFIKMTQGHFVRLFKMGTTVERVDIEKYQKKNIDFFYIKKVDYDQELKYRAAEMAKLSAQSEVSTKDAKKQSAAAQAMLRNVVNQVGFTPEAQAIAKSSVAMSLKALGSKPKLSSILTELQKKDGDYIVGHSFMVGQVACALAVKIGWNSATTLFKLSLAGFLHDISLNDAELAEIKSVEQAIGMRKFDQAQINALKLHPAKAAEYSKQFSEIPSDVDQILMQHHERPDGTGFPRTMAGKLISPLSALFIMAHDLVDAVYEKPDTNVDKFFEIYADQYQVGQFKKIMMALKNGETAKDA